MRIDFSPTNLFLSFLDGRTPLSTVLSHPAYQTIFEHAQRYSGGLTEDDVLRALAGEPSPFYGVRNLRANLERIQALAGLIREHEAEWTDLARREFARLLPDEDPSTIAVYPIIGYDMGIGLHGAVCMNLNVERYLNNPWEFFYYLIHEAAHVLYERSHAIPTLAEVNTPEERWSMFGLWLQNEGFAVYAPYRLRQEHGRLEDEDYRVLGDPPRLADSLRLFRETRDWLRSGLAVSAEEYMERIYGEERILYRAGCELFRRIAPTAGPAGVRAAFYLSGREFLERFGMVL